MASYTAVVTIPGYFGASATRVGMGSQAQTPQPPCSCANGAANCCGAGPLPKVTPPAATPSVVTTVTNTLAALPTWAWWVIAAIAAIWLFDGKWK